MGRGTRTNSLEAKLLQRLISMRERVLNDILLDINKFYDALDHYHSLDILSEYGMVPQDLHLRWYYWDSPTMAERAGRYFGTPFKGYREVTWGDPISLTIFNILVDAVLQHWFTMTALMYNTVERGVARTEGFGQDR